MAIGNAAGWVDVTLSLPTTPLRYAELRIDRGGELRTLVEYHPPYAEYASLGG